MARPARPLLALLAAATVALAGPALAEDPPPAKPFAKRLGQVTGIPYVAEVAPGLYRGAQPSKEGVAWLKEQGIRTVINLRHYHGNRTGEGRWVEEQGMRYEHLPLASSDAPSATSITRFLALLADPKLRPIYVHCQHGVDRTGTMMAVYRMEVEHWTNQEALAEMLEFGAHAIWRDLLGFVASYQPRWRSKRDR